MWVVHLVKCKSLGTFTDVLSYWGLGTKICNFSKCPGDTDVLWNLKIIMSGNDKYHGEK